MPCCCIADNPNEACGYPPKTIRATISLIITCASFFLFGFMIVYFCLTGQYTHAMAVGGIITTILGTVIGYYFGTRSKETIASPPTPSP